MGNAKPESTRSGEPKALAAFFFSFARPAQSITGMRVLAVQAQHDVELIASAPVVATTGGSIRLAQQIGNIFTRKAFDYGRRRGFDSLRSGASGIGGGFARRSVRCWILLSFSNDRRCRLVLHLAGRVGCGKS